MSRIITFEIENSRNDYAEAFRFIDRKAENHDDTWAKSHVKHIHIHDKESMLVNEYADAILQYEESKAKRGFLTGVPAQDDIFYFRVKNEMENDVINLHYFFLGSRNIDQKCCLAIIQGDEREHVEPGIISSFLLFETLAFNDENEYQIDKLEFNDKKNHTTQYLVKLHSKDNENVFLLRSYYDRKKKIKYRNYPFLMNHRRLTVSHKLFPQLLINDDYLSALRKMAKEENECDSGLYMSAKQKWDNRGYSELFVKDVLYSMALRGVDATIDLKHVADVEKHCAHCYRNIGTAGSDSPFTLPAEVGEATPFFFNDGDGARKKTVFSLPGIDLVGDVLSEYCKKCLETVIPRIPKNIKGETRKIYQNKINDLFKSLEATAEKTTVLAFCLFLSFWSFMLEEKDKKYFKEDGFARDEVLDDLLTDAQDYADGFLQLLENAVSHTSIKNCVFCIRIHHTGEDRNPANDSRKYLDERYQVPAGKEGEQEKKYFLEVLISDYNTQSDIPRSFRDHLLCSPEEYGAGSPGLVDRLTALELIDFFDYRKNGTTAIWREFYKNPNNLISHYGLLVFDHLVSFAGGVFRLYSINASCVTPENVYYRNSLENAKNADIPTVHGSESHIPGTQYEILLPIGLKHRSRSTGLNAELKLDKDVIGWKARFIADEKFDFIQTSVTGKKAMISELIASIWPEIDSMGEENTFPCFNVENTTNPLAAEVFAKLLIMLLGTHPTKAPGFFAFVNVSDGFLATFIRVFSLIYMKTGQSGLMKGRQVYLCSPNAEKEIVFYGESLLDSFNATYEISTLDKGQPLHEVKILLREEEKTRESTDCIPERSGPINVFPFDCMIPDLYRRKVEADLGRDIGDEQFGCCLKNAHMRVGSKIHTLGNYYEASLLFSFSSYVSRFAYFLLNNSVDAIEEAVLNEKVNKVILIGYESYSENLMIVFKDYLERFLETGSALDIDYVIYYDTNKGGSFNRWNEAAPDADSRFIIVVPIGSTLTTHDKIASDLCRTLGRPFDDGLSAILLHHCVVLIRNHGKGNESADNNGRIGLEKAFWQAVDDTGDQRYVIYGGSANNVPIGAGNRINYFVSVSNRWELPNQCDSCFPAPDNIIKESPLIHSNRASVVPMIMYGQKSGVCKKPYDMSFDETSNALAPLKEGLCYGHVVRDKDNHFEYYFKTERIMDAILSRDSDKKAFNKWLYDPEYIPGNPLSGQCVFDAPLSEKLRPKDGAVVYDFIVAPLHTTNAAFVYEINKVVKAKQILWVDSKREYRSNIYTKYSNLLSVYDNLSNDPRNTAQETKIEIRFHYVDDTIVTGDSFYRSRSVLQSLFPAEAFRDDAGCVTVRLFESVILLISRCSNSTKLNYVDEGHFHSYIELKISSMRNHNDACVACKNEQNFKKTLNESSATNALSKVALSKSMKYDTYAAEDTVTPEEMILQRNIDRTRDSKGQFKPDIDKRIGWLKERGYYRLVATHRFNMLLASLKDRGNPDAVTRMIWKELDGICAKAGRFLSPDDMRITKDRLYSALKVISRPFLSFEKTVLEASFQVLLEITEYCLSTNSRLLKGDDKGNIREYIRSVKAQKRDEWGDAPFYKFVRLLFSCLANLNSTYLMRRHTMDAVLKLCGSMKPKEAKDFINEYAFYIKQVLCLSGKENLSVWLEDLLTANKEPFPALAKHPRPERLSKNLSAELSNLLRLENTLPICDAMEECKTAYKRSFTTGRLNAAEDILRDNKYAKNLKTFAATAKDTLKQYFCITYRDFAGIHDSNDPKYETHCDEVFAPMAYLCYLLDESQKPVTEDGSDFYGIVLRLASDILGAAKQTIGLFVHIMSEDDQPKTIIGIERRKMERRRFQRRKSERRYSNPLEIAQPTIELRKAERRVSERRTMVRRKLESAVYQLFPKPGVPAKEMESLNDFVARVAKDDDGTLSIGDTLFIEQVIDQVIEQNEAKEPVAPGSRLAAIKLFNNNNKVSPIKSAEFYLAFRLDDKSPADSDTFIESTIMRARNLLSMRNGLVERLSADYDNNILLQYIEHQEKLKALANTRSGNHVPFENLYDKFTRIVDRTEELFTVATDDETENATELESLACALELAVDALISKLYVLGVFDTMPEQLIYNITNTEKYCHTEGCFSSIKTLEPLFRCFTNRKGYRLRLTVDPQIYTQKVYHVDSGLYLWPMMLIALMLNTLNHGYVSDAGTVHCQIKLYPDNVAPESIVVENYYKHSEGTIDGITLKALVKFFQMMSKLENLIIDDKTTVDNTTDTAKLLYFRVRIPIIKKQEGEGSNETNSID